MSAIKFWAGTILGAIVFTLFFRRSPKNFIRHRVTQRGFLATATKAKQQAQETIERIDTLLSSRRLRRRIGRKNVRLYRRQTRVLRTTQEHITGLAQLVQ